VKHEEIQENYEEEFEQQQEEQSVPMMLQDDSVSPHETLIEMGVEEPSMQEEEQNHCKVRGFGLQVDTSATVTQIGQLLSKGFLKEPTLKAALQELLLDLCFCQLQQHFMQSAEEWNQQRAEQLALQATGEMLKLQQKRLKEMAAREVVLVFAIKKGLLIGMSK
jgi:hypothetical protein